MTPVTPTKFRLPRAMEEEVIESIITNTINLCECTELLPAESRYPYGELKITLHRSSNNRNLFDEITVSANPTIKITMEVEDPESGEFLGEMTNTLQFDSGLVSYAIRRFAAAFADQAEMRVPLQIV